MALLICCATGRATTPEDELAWLVRPPPDRARVELRVTSVDASGRRQIAELALRYAQTEGRVRIEGSSRTRNDGPLTFCMERRADGTLVRCDPDGAGTTVVLDERVPGTLLPWRALARGLGEPWRVVPSESPADPNHAVVELAPASLPAGSPEAGTLRVFFRGKAGRPDYLVDVGPDGRERSRVDILAIRKTAWGRAVTRALYRDAATGARVLIEFRGGSVDAPEPKPAPRPDPSP